MITVLWDKKFITRLHFWKAMHPPLPVDNRLVQVLLCMQFFCLDQHSTNVRASSKTHPALRWPWCQPRSPCYREVGKQILSKFQNGHRLFLVGQNKHLYTTSTRLQHVPLRCRQLENRLSSGIFHIRPSKLCSFFSTGVRKMTQK